MNRYLMIANYGDDSIALMQWFIESETQVTIVSVDTGWAAPEWSERVERAEAYGREYGLDIQRLQALQSFPQAVLDRKQFPSIKFQWCAPFLKGLAINQYLDEIDPACEMTVCSARRRLGSRANRDLTEYVDGSEYFNERCMYYPLLEMTLLARDDLIRRAGFDILGHRSKECDPCIHSSRQDFAKLDSKNIEKTRQLEDSLGQTMFERPIVEQIPWATEGVDTQELLRPQEGFDMGCGMPWGCGE